MTEIKLYKSPRRAIRMLLLTTIFVAAGVYLIHDSNGQKWVGWLSILFFGLGYPVAFFHLFDKRPQIIINQSGIFDRTAHKDFITWEMICGAHLKNISGQQFICLDVDESFLPSFKNKRNYTLPYIGVGRLNLSLGQLDIDPEKLLAFVLQMLYADKEQRVELIHGYPTPRA